MYKGKRAAPSPRPRLPLPAALALAALLAVAGLLAAFNAGGPSRPGGAVPSPTVQPTPAPTPATTPEPEPSPSPAPDPAEELLAGMTLYEKACQLLVVKPSAITGVSRVTAAGETTRAALERYPVAGLLYDDTNLVTMEQAKTMLANVQGYSKIPLILTCDEEGGRVNRLMHTIGTTYIGPMLDYKDQGVDKAAENARTIAADLAACGFNMDLAPVADVWSNRANTAIGDRAYSDDFQQAAQLVSAAVGGFHEGGVACTLKHFPGHGDTSADSHYGSVYVYKTLDELRGAELVPFRAGIEAGADAVMLGHLIMADIDEQPALFSHKVVTGLLREELGFGGVVITDSLDMRAITDHYGSGEIAVAAIQAGVDLLLCPQDLDETIGAITQAVEDGTIPRQRLDESVLRVLRLKLERGILKRSGIEKRGGMTASRPVLFFSAAPRRTLSPASPKRI